MVDLNQKENNLLTNQDQFYADKIREYVLLGIQGTSNTQRAYTSDLRHFTTWCDEMGKNPLPASVATLAAYATHLAQTAKWSTISRHLATISKFYQLQGLDSPTGDKQFKVVLEGIKRANGIRQKQAPAFNLPTLKRTLKAMEGESPRILRDKVLLLLGFTGAFRRSELVALNLEDLSFSPEGLIISMRSSKTNPYGDHEEKAIYYSPDASVCPIRTLQTWISSLRRTTGPLLVRVRKGNQLTEQRLTDKTVCDVVQKYLGKSFSAHSLRASFVTIAKLNGADDSEVMRQTKHRKSDMIQRYTRIEDIRLHNAAMKLGL